MKDEQEQPIKLPDPIEWSRSLTRIAQQSQVLVSDFLKRQKMDGGGSLPGSMGDPMNIGQAFFEMAARMITDPGRIVQAQFGLWQDYMNLWQNAARRFMGADASEPLIAPAKDDKRFKDQAWNESVVFDFIKQSYLLTARCIQANVRSVEGMDDATARKVDFYTRQFVDAMAPSNFVVTNPEVLRATLESGGDNLLRGLSNLLGDLDRGQGNLKISMTDLDAFKIGVNIAVTPGSVVYHNDLMQLIQYNPTTEQVHKLPLLIIPPWINKYYILDLREKNSLVKWCVDQGYTVFMVSWVNPDEHLAAKSFEDYMLEGPLAALDAMKAATGEDKANILGYCLGGTLLACTLAYLTAKGAADRVAAASYMTTMIDFTEAGELSVFIDEEQIDALEQRMNKTGYLEGSAMSTTFNMLRANDLIWSFVVNNYLLGKDPFPFDLLYWNADSTRMPAAMHSFYLRTMYQENLLKDKGGITLAGVPIDLTTIKTPTFIVSTREDHIAPWKSTYAATHIYGGPVKFTLAASGHIAGVVNPPAANKYCHWVNAKLPKTPDEWLETAKQVEGSWWPEWDKWLAKASGGKVPARVPGDAKLKVIEPAPGEYVKVKAS